MVEYAWILLDLFVSTSMDLIPLGAAGLLILSIPRSFWRKFNTHSRKFTKDCGKACFRTQIAAWGQRRQGWRRWLGTVARVPAHRCYHSSFMVSYWIIRWNQLRKRWTQQDERDNLDKKVRRKVGHYGDLWSRSCGIHHNLMYMHVHATFATSCHLFFSKTHLAVCQNLVPLVNIKIAGKWMFIPLKMVLIGIDP